MLDTEAPKKQIVLLNNETALVFLNSNEVYFLPCTIRRTRVRFLRDVKHN
uniref:Uncharacterized protein n=1 Tax=Anopheles quadriannulatus TaxID=34691 RepID=A0A182XRR8_ANOQN